MINKTDILYSDKPSQSSGSQIRKYLNGHFNEWSKSQPFPAHAKLINANPSHQSLDPKLTFDEYLHYLKRKKNSILSGKFSQKAKKTEKLSQIPPKLNINTEPDREDFYWQATIETENLFPDHKLPMIFDESPKFTREYLAQNLPEAPSLQPFYTVHEAVELSNQVVASGKSNAAGLKIEVKSGMNIPAWKMLMKGHKDEKLIIDGLSYGWPLNWTCTPYLSCQTVRNHPTAEKQFTALIKDWYLDQVEKGMLVGPCRREDLPWKNLSTIPLQSVVKDPIEMTRRVCADPTFVLPGLPKGFGSLNDGIPKNSYMGKPYKYQLPRVRDFVTDAVEVGLPGLGF